MSDTTDAASGGASLLREGKDVAARLVNLVHRNLFRTTNGLIGGRIAGMTVVELTTTGRKSGKQRSTMLTSPIHDGDKVALVASYGGDHRHPTWFLNLRDNPDVEIRMLGRHRRMQARVAGDEERGELWPRVTAAYRGYAQYQRNTDRQIPLVILEPVPADGTTSGNDNDPAAGSKEGDRS